MTRDAVDVEQLARAAARDDVAAMDRLIEVIDAEGLARIPIRSVVVNPDAVDDIAQDVLIVVFQKLHQWDGRAKFTTWLYTVARNKAIDHLRRTRPTSSLPDDAVSDQRRISSIISTQEAVRKVVQDLRDTYREPVLLRDVDGRDYEDIARLLDLHPATVRTRVKRGRAMVEARLSAGAL